MEQIVFLESVISIKCIPLTWTGHVPGMEEGRDPFKIIRGKSTENRPLGKPTITWEDC